MTQVEHRRLRTWETDTVQATSGWRIILRYGLVQSLRSWWVLVPAILAVAYVTLLIGFASFDWASGSHGVSRYEVTGIGGMGVFIALVFCLLVGSPLFSEDLRFNAPLFYFSKPLRPGQYLFGKLGLLGTFLGGLVLVPAVITMILGFILAVPNTSPPDYRGLDPVSRAQQLEVWEQTTIIGIGDWLFVSIVILTGLVSSLLFFGSVMAAISSMTRRAWHAAMGFVAVVGGWSMLGMIAGDSARTAWSHIFGPSGWVFLVTAGPIENAYNFGPADRWNQNMTEATLVAHVLLLGFSALAFWITATRLRAQEALL